MDEERVSSTTILTWFTETLHVGSTKKLSIDDLPALPSGFDSDSVKRRFQASSVRQPPRHSISPRVSVTNETQRSEKWATHLSSAEDKNKLGVPALLWTIARCYGYSILKVGVLKVLTTGLSFVGPILLGFMVSYLEKGVTRSNIGIGVLLIILLGGSSALSAILNTNYNVRTTVIKNNMQGALVRIVFSRCLSLPLIARKELFLTDSQVNNLIQVDVDQVSNCFKSLHDLWALPIQILVACVLLYINIQAAFLVGVAVILLMTPFNSLIAKRIGRATESLMKAKDSRVKVITEALSNVVSLKMSGLEGAVLFKSGEYRDEELKYLAQRKYLDAVCVFLWALTPVLVPFVTFVATVYLDVELSAAEVVTALALLNMLIFPMNALPWVINGLMEARVSVRRLAKVLSSEDGETLFVKNRFARKNRHRVKFSEAGARLSGENDFSGDEDSVHSSPSEHSSGMSGSPQGRQLSGERLARREDLTLHIPATVWSYVTTYETKALLGDTTACSDAAGADSPVHVALDDGGADLESQLRSPLLTQRATQAEDTDPRVLPFALTVNEVRLQGPQLLGIVGATGSGKSTTLLGILGEIRGHKQAEVEGELAADTSFRSSSSISMIDQVSGSGSAVQLVRSILEDRKQPRRSNVCTGNVAYCPQVPPMHAGSMRSNILMGSEYDEELYHSVLEGCCLAQDLEGGSWVRGDLTEVGAGGSSLSGGQRLRIGVARAVYAYSCDLLLLDDPYSALDATTAMRLSEYLRSVVVGQQRRTVIIATHMVTLLQDADLVLVLDQGQEVARGAYSDLQHSSMVFQALIGEQLASTTVVEDEGAEANPRRGVVPTESDALGSSATSAGDGQGPEDVSYEEKLEFSASGYLERKVYWAYFRSVGLLLTVIIVVVTAAMQTVSIGLSFWWAYWATHQDDYSRQKFVSTSTALVIVAVVAGLLRSVLFAQGGLNAARKLYHDLAVAVFHTDIRFFEGTAIGRLTNRFGRDSNTIDDSLPFIMNILLAQAFLLVGSAFVMAVTDPPILVLLVVVAVVYHHMQRFYRQSSRELRRLDSVHRSPVYTVFLECIESAPTLRGFGEHCVSYFDRKLQRHLDASLRVALSVELASQWLGVRLQLLGAAITTLLAATIVLNALYNIFPMNAGMAGLSLIYSFTIVNNLNGFLNALSETEQEMVSVERVVEYCDLPNEFGETLVDGHSSNRHGGGAGLCGSGCCGGERGTGGAGKLGVGTSAGSSAAAYSALHMTEVDDMGDAAEDRAAPSDLSRSLASVLVFGSPSASGKAGLKIGSGESGHIGCLSHSGDHSFASRGGSSLRYRLLSRNPEGLELENVSMTYAAPPAERTTFSTPIGTLDCLRELTITIRPGSRVAVVGRTGSGKSSLLRLLLRINDYHTGTVKLGGVELRSIPKHRLRSKLCVIPQKPLLFSGTVRFNLDPLGEFADEDLSAALEMCKIAQTLANGGAGGRQPERRSEAMTSIERFTEITLRSSSSFLQRAPVGDASQAACLALLDFVVTDGGANLSVGQQQLLCLARAILRRSDLILLDEATAAVDAQIEALLYASLAQYVEATGASMLMVCHKLGGVNRVCNKVLTMEEGRIVSYEDI